MSCFSKDIIYIEKSDALNFFSVVHGYPYRDNDLSRLEKFLDKADTYYYHTVLIKSELDPNEKFTNLIYWNDVDYSSYRIEKTDEDLKQDMYCIIKELKERGSDYSKVLSKLREAKNLLTDMMY